MTPHPTGEQYELRHGDQTAVVVQVGGGLRAYDVAARVVCDPVTGSLQEVARQRPVFALFAFESELNPLRESFELVEGPRLPLPYGDRDLDHEGVLYQLLPIEGAAAP